MTTSEMINTIQEGNCVDVMSQMDDNSIDLTLTSPPYDNLRTYKGFCFTSNFVQSFGLYYQKETK